MSTLRLFRRPLSDTPSRFRTFGPLRYAKITMDRATGRSRGTGFACFWKKEDADKALEEAARVYQITGSNTTGLNSNPAHNPFALPSILTVDPSSQAAAKLVIHGRTLDVVRALTREDATMKKEDSEKARQKADKRNTYLMREGGTYCLRLCVTTKLMVVFLQSSFPTLLPLLPYPSSRSPNDSILSTPVENCSKATRRYTSPRLVSVSDRSLFTLPTEH